MVVQIGKIEYKPLTEANAWKLLQEGVIGEKAFNNLKALKALMTEIARQLIRKKMDKLGEFFAEAGKVYGKFRSKYQYCLIPDPVVDIGLAYLHPAEGRPVSEARELMITAVRNIDLILKLYPTYRAEKVKKAIGKFGELRKKVGKKK